jgi:PEP-CTERM motif
LSLKRDIVAAKPAATNWEIPSQKSMKIPLLSLLIAANCCAQVYTNNFNVSPPLGGNDSGGSSPGLWYVDRKAPATFASASFGGGTSLDVGVSASDYSGNTGNSTFYDTQGRKYYLTSSGVGSFVSAQLYIPSSWRNLNVSPGLWLTIYDNSSQVAGFPIIGFYSDGTGNSGGSYFRVYNESSYVNLNTAINWDAWNTFQFTFTAGGIVNSINGTDVFTDTAAVANGGTTIANVMLESKNFGTGYDAYWNNLITPSPTIGAVPEPGSLALLALGGALVLRMKKFRR